MVNLNEQSRKNLNRVMESLLAMHEGNEGFTKRLKSAYNLIVNGKILANGDCQSESGNGIYHTDFSGIPCQHTCTCPDFKNRGVQSDYGKLCKHSLANLLSYLAQIELPTAFETSKAVPALLGKLLELGNQGQLKSGELIGRTSKGGRLILTQLSGGYGLVFKDQMKPAVTSGLLVTKKVDLAYQSAQKSQYALSETALSEYENFIKHCKN